MSTGTKLLTAGVIFLLALGIASCRWLTKRGEALPSARSDINQVIGRALARETAELLGGQGDVVLLSSERGLYAQQTSRPQAKAFKEELEEYPGLNVVATKMIESDPDFPGVLLRADLFFDLLNEFSDVAAVVSLVGYPELFPGDLPLPEDRPAIVVYESLVNIGFMDPNAVQLADVAIVPNQEPLEAAPGGLTPEEEFAARYDIQRR